VSRSPMAPTNQVGTHRRGRVTPFGCGRVCCVNDRNHYVINMIDALGSVVRGYYAYHAVPTNIYAMQAFRTQVERHWSHALSRRSQRGRLNWETMRRLSRRWIPAPKIMHPWPGDRFDVRTRGRSRVR
jgi:hypothetical protein